jgi:hypothetical protein
MSNRNLRPASGGYSFEQKRLLPWDDDDADLQYETAGREQFLVTPEDTRILDVGAVDTVEDIGGKPATTSSDRRVLAVAGHGYIVRLWDRTLIRLRVALAAEEGILFDWLPLGKDTAPVGFAR